MKKGRVFKRAAIGWLIFLFIFSPLSFNPVIYFEKVSGWYDYDGSIFIEEDETWHKEDELVFDQNIFIMNGATLTIEPGAVIKFRRNENWIAPTLNVLGGRIFAKGTAEEPIVFEPESLRDTFFINFENTPDRLENDVLPSFFRFVEINGGGESDESGLIQSYWGNKSLFFSMALAAGNGFPALYYRGGKLHIENSRFSDNEYADVEVLACNEQENAYDYLEIVNSNFEGDFEQIALKSNTQYESGENCVNNVILQDNWYGSIGGPTQDDSLTQKGKKLIGQYNLLGWKFNNQRNDPVIVIPGITGSSEVGKKWKIDPITHAYDNLIESLVRNGYTKNKNLFDFPYDWKENNKTTAEYLKNKIKETVASTRVSKIDLVAHSMGGLIARVYIEGNYYENNIDQLITLGTPHNGAPESYLQWEAGEGFFTLSDLIARHHFSQEAKHKGYDNLFEYLRAKVPSVAELLPDYDYLIDINDNSMRNYPDNYPRNVFLEELNDPQNKNKLSQVDFTNIVGDMEEKGTISSIRVGEKGDDGKWENGIPENFYDSDTDRGLNYADGDMTVPLVSAEDILANKNVKVKSSHGDLPTKAQCEVISELTNKSKEECHYTTVFNIVNIFLINVFSPIDIQIVTPDGKKIGKNFTTGETFNEIEGAYYSGYYTDSEVIAIPNPQKGEYQILTQGTGSGEYRVEATKIFENENSPQNSKEVSVVFNGIAAPNKSDSFVATVTEDKVIDQLSEAITTVGEKEVPSYAIRANVIKDDILDESSSNDNASGEKNKSSTSNFTFGSVATNHPDIITMPISQIQETLGVSARKYDMQPIENNVYSGSKIIYLWNKIINFFQWLFKFFF